MRRSKITVTLPTTPYKFNWEMSEKMWEVFIDDLTKGEFSKNATFYGDCAVGALFAGFMLKPIGEALEINASGAYTEVCALGIENAPNENATLMGVPFSVLSDVFGDKPAVPVHCKTFDDFKEEFERNFTAFIDKHNLKDLANANEYPKWDDQLLTHATCPKKLKFEWDLPVEEWEKMRAHLPDGEFACGSCSVGGFFVPIIHSPCGIKEVAKTHVYADVYMLKPSGKKKCIPIKFDEALAVPINRETLESFKETFETLLLDYINNRNLNENLTTFIARR